MKVIRIETSLVEVTPGHFQKVEIKVLAPRVPKKLPSGRWAKAQYPSVLRPIGALK